MGDFSPYVAVMHSILKLLLYMLLWKVFIYKYLSIIQCSHAGCVFYYTIVQIAVMWLCHVSVIFLKMQFPLNFRNLEKRRLIHLIVILLAVVLPWIPVSIGFATGGYLVPIYPVIVCFIKNQVAAYYSFAFVMTVIIAIGAPMLIIAFSTAIKVIIQWYKMLFQYFPPTFQHKIMKRINANGATPMPTTEIKVLILLCYFLFLLAMLLTVATLLAINVDNLNLYIVEYLVCEATGRSPKCDAIKEAFQPLTAQKIWMVVIILLGAYPGLQLLYVVNIDKIARKCLLFMSDKTGIHSASALIELRRKE